MGYYDKLIESDSFLEHHGIMGQKWGVRRYQNPDGTLTAEGRERYAELNDRVDRKKSDKERSGRMYDKAIANRQDRVDRKKGDKERSQKMYDKAIANRQDRVDRKKDDKERSGKMYDKAIERRSKDPDRIERKQQDKEKSQKMYDKAIANRQDIVDRKEIDKERSGKIYDKAIANRQEKVDRKKDDKERSQKMYDKAIEKREYLRDHPETYAYSKIISNPDVIIAGEKIVNKLFKKDEAKVDRQAHAAAKKAGMDFGDNYKIYKSAAAGDKKSQDIINEWEKNAK